MKAKENAMELMVAVECDAGCFNGHINIVSLGGQTTHAKNCPRCGGSGKVGKPVPIEEILKHIKINEKKNGSLMGQYLAADEPDLEYKEPKDAS